MRLLESQGFRRNANRKFFRIEIEGIHSCPVPSGLRLVPAYGIEHNHRLLVAGHGRFVGQLFCRVANLFMRFRILTADEDSRRKETRLTGPAQFNNDRLAGGTVEELA